MANFREISKNIRQINIDNPETPGGKIVWIDILDPGKTEIEYLRKNYHFQLSHLQASSAKIISQRPVIEQTENYLFLILHFPIIQNENIVASEIEFFVGRDFVITLHNNNIKAINNFFNLYRKDIGSFLSFKHESSVILLYEILEKLIIDCYGLLDNNSIKITQIENLIFGSNFKNATNQILFIRRNIINFRKIMQNHKNIIKRLARVETGLVPEERMGKYYRELLEHTKRIWENLENQKEMIEVLNSTNESYVNDRISQIMKTLTIISVIVFPLTLLAAIFGMNVVKGMPFIETKNGFWIIISIMLAGCLAMLLFFEKKRWL